MVISCCFVFGSVFFMIQNGWENHIYSWYDIQERSKGWHTWLVSDVLVGFVNVVVVHLNKCSTWLLQDLLDRRNMPDGLVPSKIQTSTSMNKFGAVWGCTKPGRCCCSCCRRWNLLCYIFFVAPRLSLPLVFPIFLFYTHMLTPSPHRVHPSRVCCWTIVIILF